MGVYNYPAPRAPLYKKPTSTEECLSQARMLIKKTIGRAALGPVKKGDKILIVTLPDQDKYLKEAVIQAFTEEGADKVDFIFEHELSNGEPRRFNVEDGWKEADTVENAPWDMSGSTFYSDIGPGLRKYLDEHADYTGVFYGLGGRGAQLRQLDRHKQKFRGNWLFNNWEEFFSKAWIFPDELWMEIERKIIDALPKASAVRITDPEGTFLEYPLTAEEAKRWQMTAWAHGHLLLDPLQATSHENRRIPPSSKVPPVFRDINGVLAGTSNHQGFIPRIELYFESGKLVDIKGGGKYGEMISALMDKYKNIQWPYYPGKGLFWFCDCALCTVVKAFRRRSDLFESYWRLPNITERNRAGIFHMGFGSRKHGDDYLNYAQAHKLPTGHIHIHNYFVTFEIKIRGTDNWYKIVDKGWLTAMDDPEIRALAVKYGDPDELLRYEWIPPVPGINCEGNYRTDYAENPVTYLKSRIQNKQPI